MNRQIVPTVIGAAVMGGVLVVAGLLRRAPSAVSDHPDLASAVAAPAVAQRPTAAVAPAPAQDRWSAPVASTLAPAPGDEAGLMNRLRFVEDRDPALAIELAREGNRRFPLGSDGAERAAIIVKSLARQGHLSEARGEAETMVNQYAGTGWALEVEQNTGAHPRETTPRR